MTPAQNRLIGVISVLATIAVLVLGGSGSSIDATVAAALAKGRAYDVAGPASATPASDSPNDASGDVVSSDLAAADGASAVSEPAAGDVPADGGDTGGGAPPPVEDPKPSKIRHVFVIALAGHGFDATFGPESAASYLTRELVPKGTLLSSYRALGRADLPDYLAMVGGQPPNDDTRAGCPTYTEIAPTVAPSKTGEIRATGCVFPNTVTTLGDQLSASRHKWGAYIEDLEKGPDGKATCRRPDSNAVDDTVKGRVGDGYTTRHNPFVYYHSLLDLGDCDAVDGPLDRLETDLGSVSATPNYAFIAPNLCNDGTESPCADGSPGGLPAADAFLARWVPKILASPAYRRDGLLIVTFAGSVAPASLDDIDGGPLNGALLVSRFAKAGAVVGADYDPYSLLRSVEDLFALKPLARAVDARSFAETILGEASTGPAADD